MDDHVVELDRGWSLWRRAALRSAGLPYERLAVLVEPDDIGQGRDRRAALRLANRAALDALLLDDTFHAALTWQNPDAVDNWAGEHAAALHAGERPELRRLSYRQAILARYAQRYCAKNDTIGFFGPVAWARLGAGPTRYTGGGGVRRAEVFVEVWAVQAIAWAWCQDPRLAPHLPVRLDPACTPVDGQVRRPHRAPLILDGDEARLIAAVRSGTARTAQLADRLDLPVERVHALLDRLSDARVVQVGFRVPISSRPVDALAEQVATVDDTALRDELLARLGAVRRACRAVAGAGDPVRLRATLRAADEALQTTAGGPLQRRPEFTTGGRTPLYLDCRRDLDATVSPEALADLAGPLSVLLDSARWLCGEVATETGDALVRRYRTLAATRDEVTLADLHLAAADLFEPGGGWLHEVVGDFQLRWTEIIGDGGNGPVTVDREHARKLADVLFPAPELTWAAARLHSPDLMLRRAADGYRWVLGELHVALNTLESRHFSTQADDPAALVAATAAAIAPGRVVPVYPGSARDVSSRSYPPLSLDPPGRYRYVSFGSDDGHPSGAPSTPATAITVGERAGILWATCRSEGWAAPVLECFGEFLSSIAVNLFKLRRLNGPSAPRVDIGTTTVCRATWRVPAVRFADLPLHAKDPGQDELRRLAARLGVPRHVFARVPGDPKPFHVDFRAPLLVDNLARAGRRAAATEPSAEIELVEMLPAPDELWLRLPDGTYTSELRVVAVDPVGSAG